LCCLQPIYPGWHWTWNSRRWSCLCQQTKPNAFLKVMPSICQFNDPPRSVVITKPDLPVPVINYLSNSPPGAFVSQALGGFASWKSQLKNRISRMPASLAALVLLFLILVQNGAAVDIRLTGFDSASLVSALKQAAPGDTIRLPAGTFEIAEPIQLKSGVKLVGAGQEKTRIVYAGTKLLSLVRINDCQDVEVAHLTLDGQDNPLVQDGMTGGNSRRLFIHHVTFCNLGNGSSSFSHGIIFSGDNPTMERGVTDSIISDCRFEKIGLKAEYGGGIRLAWGSVRNRIERNVIRDTGRGGIFGDHSAELVIRENQVSGSGGAGLGIEIWGGCPRSLIEDNVVDHWISVDRSDQTAVRRNVVGTDDSVLKFIGIEIIAQNAVVTDNIINRGALVGLSVSNRSQKNNVYWGYNQVSDCAEWGAQFQGETGGIADHYFYRCNFKQTIRGDPRSTYPKDSGHGFRFNDSCRGLVFEACAFCNNGGYGIQFLGPKVDDISFLRCGFTNNGLGSVSGLSSDKTVEFRNCSVGTEGPNSFPPAKEFSEPPPVVDFRLPELVRAGTAAQFECQLKGASGEIVERLWDFGDGIPEVAANPSHTFDQPGKYRVTLIVWDAAGRGARTEKVVEVMPGK
jgi:PKD repeat protein